MNLIIDHRKSNMENWYEICQKLVDNEVTGLLGICLLLGLLIVSLFKINKDSK